MVHCGTCGNLFLKNEGEKYKISFECKKCGTYNINMRNIESKELSLENKKYYCPNCKKYIFKGRIDSIIEIKCPHCEEIKIIY